MDLTGRTVDKGSVTVMGALIPGIAGRKSVGSVQGVVRVGEFARSVMVITLVERRFLRC